MVPSQPLTPAPPPAADGVIPGTGHFHVLVDLPAAEEGEALPFDATHLHYGKGQAAADVELAPVSAAAAAAALCLRRCALPPAACCAGMRGPGDSEPLPPRAPSLPAVCAAA